MEKATWCWEERWGGISRQPMAEAEFAFGPQHGGNPLGIPKLECAMESLISEKLCHTERGHGSWQARQESLVATQTQDTCHWGLPPPHVHNQTHFGLCGHLSVWDGSLVTYSPEAEELVEGALLPEVSVAPCTI